jgi:hypothetical protein
LYIQRVSFIVVLYTAAVTDSLTDAGFLCDEAVVFGERIKERLCVTPEEGMIMPEHVACIKV